MDEPVGEAGRRGQAVAQVPLAAQPEPVAVPGEDLGIGPLPLQVAHRVGRHVAVTDPVVHAVLGGNLAGQQAGPRR